MRCTASSCARVRPSMTRALVRRGRRGRRAVQNGLHTPDKLYHSASLVYAPRHEHSDGSPASLGRNCARKSDRDDLAENRHRRARDARADLLEARLRRADALARKRADDLHPAGRAQVSRRRRGNHRARRRGAAHPVRGSSTRPKRSKTPSSSTCSARSGRTGSITPTTTSSLSGARTNAHGTMAIDRQGTGAGCAAHLHRRLFHLRSRLLQDPLADRLVDPGEPVRGLAGSGAGRFDQRRYLRAHRGAGRRRVRAARPARRVTCRASRSSLGFWTPLFAFIAFFMALNFQIASGAMFHYSFLSSGYGLPVLGSTLALALGGVRLPWSVR